MMAIISPNWIDQSKEVDSVFRRVREEVAQGQTEYALLLAAMSLALLLMLFYFGGRLSDTYQWIINQLAV